jgi:hypothetical protein
MMKTSDLIALRMLTKRGSGLPVTKAIEAESNLGFYYPCQETSGTTFIAKDANGFAPTLNGTINSTTIAQTATDALGLAHLFDGINDYNDMFSAALVSAFDETKGTILFFAKMLNAGVWTDGQFRAFFAIKKDGSNQVTIHKSSTNNTLDSFHIAGGTTDTVQHTYSNTAWFMPSITWDKTVDEMKFFINGSQIGSTQSGLGVFGTPIAIATFGARDTTPTQVTSGWGNHFTYYNVAKSGASLLTIAQAGGMI